MTAANTPIEQQGLAQRVFAQYGRYLLLVGFIVLAAIVFQLANDNFLSVTNIGIMMRSMAVLLLLSLGMTVVMITAGIDLSVGSNVAFAGAVGVIALTETGSPIIGFAMALVAGMAIGLLNGVFVGRLKLSAFMVTLATFALARGLALVLLDADALPLDDELYLWLGRTTLGDDFPVSIVAVALVILAMTFVMHRTTFGRDVFAVGSNRHTAYLLGRATIMTTVLVYVVSGLMAGLSSIITVGRLNSAQPWAGLNMEFDAITAVILGGTSLYGGRGTILGTVLGVILIAVIVNGLILSGTNPFLQSLIRGALLVGVVVADALASRGRRA
jgi:ribose transport system permease protein